MKYKIIRNKLLKQYNLGSNVGAVKDLMGRSMFWLAPINLIMLAATTYNTTAREYLAPYAPWFTLPLFLLSVGVLLLLTMMFEYKVMLPSSIRFGTFQWYKHGNPLRDDVAAILKRLEALEANVQELAAKMDTPKG